jgi:hypothetical protein
MGYPIANIGDTTLPIQGHHKHIGTLQELEYLLAARLLEHRVTKGSGEPL